jgi:hypothetical protein
MMVYRKLISRNGAPLPHGRRRAQPPASKCEAGKLGGLTPRRRANWPLILSIGAEPGHQGQVQTQTRAVARGRKRVK